MQTQHPDRPSVPGWDSGLRAHVRAADRYEADHRSKRDRLRGWWRVERREPTPSYLGVVEGPHADSYAVCCSGGGVRSAAFNLGALQVLARTRYLKQARYVAAVSGGSYIAAAIGMVFQKGEGGSDEKLLERQRPFAPGSPEEQYLRNRSSYMAPGASGKIRLALRVVVGLLVNLALILTFLAVVGAGLALLYRRLFPDLVTGLKAGKPCTGGVGCEFSASFSPELWVPAVAVAGIGLAASLLSIVVRLREHARERMETWGVRLLGAAAILALVLVALPALLEVVRDLNGKEANAATTKGKPPPDVLGPLGFTGIAGVLITALLQLRTRVAEPARVLQELGRARRVWRSLGSALRVGLAYAVAAIAGPLALAAFLVAFVSASLSNDGIVYWGVVAACAAVCAIIAFWLDVTSWSLHPFYRRRLCTAFALKRVPDPNVPIGRAVERDFDSHPPMSQARADGWPTLLVCAAANISDRGATPPGRGVTSFTFSAYAIGGPLVGAMGMKRYEALTWQRKRDFTLPAVVAMSGAALSPSMGKLTRWPLRFIMGLANVRLGVWVPNPRKVASDSMCLRHDEGKRKRLYPKPGARYLARELLGLNHIDRKYIYVTDGGHYENLGLVEVLRRGCTNVFCFDASGGESFANLGDAVALARSELQVEIEIDPSPLLPKGERRLADTDSVAGTITYPNGVRGTLVYSRTVMTAAAPWDVHAYHEADGKFPHNPTADQLYTDQKFEAYRALGMTAATNAVRLLQKTETHEPPIADGKRFVPGAPPRVSPAARTPAG
jgi:hypothetical protein